MIASHELSHIELHTRLGLLRTWRRDIPQWFDEGVAVVVSNDPRYLAPPDAPDRCLASSDKPMPTTRTAWIESAASQQLYAKAACRVSRWMAQAGGPTAVVTLVDEVAKGIPFGAAYSNLAMNSR